VLVEIAEARLLPAAEGMVGERHRDRHVDSDHADVDPAGEFAGGVAQGAYLVVDGRDFKLQGYENGYFVGGCLFDDVTPDMDIYKTEIFGPVLSVVRAKNYEEALSLPMKHEYGNGVSIYTRDGDAARDFTSRINIGMVGVNVPIPVPLAYHTFGGWKASSFGDLNQHGTDSIKFWTRTKTVTSRWPSGIKDGAEFSIPTME
jgi:malonate-semialdehyde dehydrogenase (acetylating)/methylmalonate-semialdehyde dehydrogenase